MSARIYTTRRLKSASGADIKSTAGKYIRVKIHKETRQVSKVKPSVWTEEANTAYAQRYPNNIDLKKPRKKKMVNTAPPAQEVTPPPNEKEEKEDCPICQCELPKATTTLECGHSYCTKCILTWFQRNNNCPMCRATVPEAAGQRGLRRTLNIGVARAIIESTNRDIDNRYAVVPTRHILAARTRRWGNAGSNFAMAVLANLSDIMEAAPSDMYDRMCPIYNPNN
tara:strand:- start:32 stop:706 length:675 start_codon:yes stop_codon:yes gene_type:complete